MTLGSPLVSPALRAEPPLRQSTNLANWLRSLGRLGWVKAWASGLVR
jgi:hypothetical protein